MAPLDGTQNGREDGRLKVLMQSERALTVGRGSLLRCVMGVECV